MHPTSTCGGYVCVSEEMEVCLLYSSLLLTLILISFFKLGSTVGYVLTSSDKMKFMESSLLLSL